METISAKKCSQSQTTKTKQKKNQTNCRLRYQKHKQTCLLWRSRFWLHPPTRRQSQYSVLACHSQTWRYPLGSQAGVWCLWIPRTAFLHRLKPQLNTIMYNFQYWGTIAVELGRQVVNQMRVVQFSTCNEKLPLNTGYQLPALSWFINTQPLDQFHPCAHLFKSLLSVMVYFVRPAMIKNNFLLWSANQWSTTLANCWHSAWNYCYWYEISYFCLFNRHLISQLRLEYLLLITMNLPYPVCITAFSPIKTCTFKSQGVWRACCRGSSLLL